MQTQRIHGAAMSTAAAILLLLAASPVPAQVQQHDVTPVVGADVAGGPFAPRPEDVPRYTPEMAIELEAARACVAQQLDARALMDGITKQPIGVAAQEPVLAVILGVGSPDALAAVLAGGGAERQAQELARTLVGIVTRPRTGQLADAIGHFNALLQRSEASFVEQPPPELMAVHAVLSMLALRDGCVPPDRVELCLVTPERMLTTVEAYVHPITGDTLLQGTPYRVTHDAGAPQYAANRSWFVADQPVTFQNREFLRYGERRILSPRELARAGEYDGVTVFTQVGAVAPVSEIYLPAGPGCDFQPYAPRSTVETPITVCVVNAAGDLGTVAAAFRPLSGDTLVAGQLFSEVQHAGLPQYAAGHDWFIADSPIAFRDFEYVKFGATRVLSPGSLVAAGTYEGVTVFVESAARAPDTEIFLPAGPGCAFQPYLAREEIRVRG
ncbi:MAG TPA: hypothetical protein VNZ57_16165 [Longimicrobiales bacterium]|nr:hypothetical protein [Longimicrobiales bacterium]